MNSFGITDKGKVRRENQDSFLIERVDAKSCLVAVLCDGMGGAQAGNVASDLAVKSFMSGAVERIGTSRLKRPDYGAIMSQACTEANSMVYSYSCFDSVYAGMGTTMVAAVLDEDRCCILNVGDSRAYRLSKNKLTQLTRDHSLVQDMVDKGIITPEEARNHPRKNVITRVLGVDQRVEGDLFTPKLSKGDLLLLCSDGLSNMLEDREMLAIAKTHPDPLSLGKALMDEALDRGARDNVTVVIISK